MKWNGTVSQVGTSHIPPRLATAKPTQATSSQPNCRNGQSRRLRTPSATIDLVPLAAHRPDRLRAELRPQPSHVDVDHVGAGVEVVLPDRGEQPLLGDGLARMLHQLAEQQELAFGQRHRPDPLSASRRTMSSSSCPASSLVALLVLATTRRCAWTRASSSSSEKGLAR